MLPASGFPGLVTLLVSAGGMLVSCASVTAQNATDTEDDCVPAFANQCFAVAVNNVKCFTVDKRMPRCRDVTFISTCRSFDDALNCTSDVIDSDCAASGGRIVYDGWLAGLRGVHRYLCRGAAMDMGALLACDNPMDYVDCLEKRVGIAHVADLFKVKLDHDECSRVLRAATECKQQNTCPLFIQRRNTMQSALVAFLVESPCRATIVSRSPASACRGAATSAGAVAAMALLAVLALLLAATLLFVAQRTACFRIPLPRRLTLR